MLLQLRKLKKNILRKKLSWSISHRKGSSLPPNKEELIILMDGHPFIHDDEIKLFATIAEKSPGPIVEIGSAFGASASLFLLHSKMGVKVNSIDPFIVDSMGTFQAKESICKKNVLRILRTFRKEDRYSDWTVYPDYSFNVVRNWKSQIDTIFIDGDHTYEAVKKDFEDWYPLVKKGGHILIHDSRKEENSPENTFNRGWPGPTKLALELRSSTKVKLVQEVFSVTMWEKL